MESTQEHISNTLAECFPEEAVKSFLHTAINYEKHIAIWSMPESSSFEVCMDLSEKPADIDSIDFNELAQGFIISPFNFPVNKASYLKSDIYWNSKTKDLKAENNNSLTNEIVDKILSIPNNTSQIEVNKLKKHTGVVDGDYRSQVQEAIDYINDNDEFCKVVLSRTEFIETNALEQLHNLFIDSINKYPYSFNYIIYSPEFGLWFGATPEVLLSVDNDNIFETMALAGTQAYDGGSLKDAAWTQKEIEEQALVSRFIINCFKKIRLREFTESGPKTSMAGNLMHLRTDFNVDLRDVHFPDLANVMVDLLHPTSAVCGMPKAEAKELIDNTEKHNRELYSGFLGPVHMSTGTTMFVNLRCSRIYQNVAKLFAGAGITADSNAEKEFNETELKFQTIRNLLI